MTGASRSDIAEKGSPGPFNWPFKKPSLYFKLKSAEPKTLIPSRTPTQDLKGSIRVFCRVRPLSKKVRYWRGKKKTFHN